jgi:hypothetical protein
LGEPPFAEPSPAELKQALPSDFAETYTLLRSLDWESQPADRLFDQLKTVTSENVRAIAAENSTMGFIPNPMALLAEYERLVHDKLCSEGRLRRPFGAKSLDGVEHISGFIALIVGPQMATAHFVLFFAFWISKMGLDAWCAIPQPKADQP